MFDTQPLLVIITNLKKKKHSSAFNPWEIDCSIWELFTLTQEEQILDDGQVGPFRWISQFSKFNWARILKLLRTPGIDSTESELDFLSLVNEC